MDDFSDKHDEVIYRNAEGDTVESYDLSEFITRCNGKTRPVIVRPEEVESTSEEEYDKLPIWKQRAWDYGDRWFEAYHGKDHVCVCCTCSKDFKCEAERGHIEVGAVAALLPFDDGSDAGAMVFAICVECADKYSDEKLADLLAENIGGVHEPAPEHEQTHSSHTVSMMQTAMSNDEIARLLPQVLADAATRVYYSVLRGEVPPLVYIEKMLALCEHLKKDIVELGQKGGGETAPPSEPKTSNPEQQLDLNLLVGED